MNKENQEGYRRYLHNFMLHDTQINRLKYALSEIRDKCTKTMEVDMGTYESVPVGFTHSIYDMAHAALIYESDGGHR